MRFSSLPFLFGFLPITVVNAACAVSTQSSDQAPMIQRKLPIIMELHQPHHSFAGVVVKFQAA